MAPQLSMVPKRPLTLGDLCPEIVCKIVEILLDMNPDRNKKASWEWNPSIEHKPLFRPLRRYKDALNFAATCTDLYQYVTPTIYSHDVRYNMSAALLISAKLNNRAGVKKSLEAGAEVHTGDTTESMTYYIETPERVKSSWIPLNLRDQATALHWAACYGHKDIVLFLLDRDADINYRVRLDTAEWQNRQDSGRPTRQLILDHYPISFCTDDIAIQVDTACETLEGIDPNIVRLKMEQGANPLYFAIDSRCYDMAELLIESGASMITHTGSKTHALHQAVSNCDLDMVKLILRYETVDIDSIRDTRHASPLHYIDDFDGENVNEAVEIIKALVQHGASVNATDVYERSPLKLYIREPPRERVISELIRHGSHIVEEFYLKYTFDPENFPDGLKSAFREAEVRGFPLLADIPLPSAFASLNALRLRYRHFYSLVKGTNVMPDHMIGWGEDKWEEYWEKRPLACTSASRLGGLWD
jgi:ankyrin repeat protein